MSCETRHQRTGCRLQTQAHASTTLLLHGIKSHVQAHNSIMANAKQGEDKWFAVPVTV